MSNNQKHLREAFLPYLLAGSNNFTTAVGDRIYYHRAPQGQLIPYAVVDVLTSDEGRDSASKMYNHTVQVLIAATNLPSLEDIVEKAMARIDDCEAALIVTGFSTITVLKDFQSQPELIENVWNQIIQYSITLDQ